LYVLMTGVYGTQWKYVEGGIAYMAGEPDLFWSMGLLWRQFGTVLPDLPKYSFLDETMVAKELDRMTSMVSSGRTNISSACLAAVKTVEHMRIHPLDSHSLPWLDDVEEPNGESKQGEYDETKQPQWYMDVAKIWDEALNEYRESNTLPCMFANTPFGCAARSCAYIHSESWRKTIEHLKKYPFYTCNHCGSYGRNRCGKCEKAMYCSNDCFRADWVIKHKHQCEG
jgi:hypothetical protein